MECDNKYLPDVNTLTRTRCAVAIYEQLCTDLSPDCYKDVRINNKKANDAEIHRNVIPAENGIQHIQHNFK